MPDLYKSEAWLKRKVQVEKKTPEEIAKLCDTSLMTIYRYIDKYGLRKKRL
jgi:DNA-binding MurR/RpiR family transcriptional regulator